MGSRRRGMRVAIYMNTFYQVDKVVPSQKTSPQVRGHSRTSHVVCCQGDTPGFILSPVWLAPPYAATADRAWRERLSEHR